MKHLMGVMCCVAFVISSAAYLAQPTDAQAKVHKVDTLNRFDTRSYQTQGQKAATLEIVWMEGCPPCRRIKIVAIRLVAEGYDVILTNMYDDTRGSSRYPSLYYLDDNGGQLRKEVGFKTADHIKEYLGK